MPEFSRLLLACFVVPSLLFSLPAWAASRDELQNTRKEIEKARAHQAELEAQSAKLADELEGIQEQLVRLASAVQKSDAELVKAQEALQALTQEISEKKTALASRQARLETLIRAALHISRMPPEAMMVMPGDTMEKMKAARAMKMASESIGTEMAAIQKQLAELAVLQQKQEQRRDDIAVRRKQLDKERAAMQQKLEARKALRAKLGAEQQQEAERIAQLARKAEDLKGLMDNIERLSQKQPDKTPDSEDLFASTQDKKIRSFAAAKGRMKAPLSGRVMEGFGDRDGHSGGVSKGLLIAAGSKAQVISPYDGQVVYTGTFLNYGRMVIIRHSDGFHTLMAGFARIDVSAGQFLLEGEPIGAMGDSTSGNRLYVELRKRNQPIDPEPWMTGFNPKE